jgi:hypothetical protein
MRLREPLISNGGPTTRFAQRDLVAAAPAITPSTPTHRKIKSVRELVQGQMNFHTKPAAKATAATIPRTREHRFSRVRLVWPGGSASIFALETFGTYRRRSIATEINGIDHHSTLPACCAVDVSTKTTPSLPLGSQSMAGASNA